MWKLLDHPEFNTLRNVVDNTLKERTSQGLSVRKSYDIIPLSHEDRFFQTGLLSEQELLQLLNSMLYE